MNGDVAEQTVHLTLEGVEIAAKISGQAAKEITALIISLLKSKDKNKIKGRQRLTSMLRSGKELKVFTVNSEDLKQFAKEAKRYGVVYCALKGRGKSKDGLVDIMVRAEDASKINRIVERFKFGTVDTASIKNEITKSKEQKENTESEIEINPEDIKKADDLISDLMSDVPKKEDITEVNPSLAETEKDRPLEPTSEQKKKDEKISSDKRPSVRKKLKEIKERQAKGNDTPVKDKTLQKNETPKIPKKPKER